MHGDLGLIKAITWTFFIMTVIFLFVPGAGALTVIFSIIWLIGVIHLKTCWMCDGR